MRTEAVRAEIAAAIPAYNGIQNLKKQADNFQYGGPMFCANWKFATPDGKAHFRAKTAAALEPVTAKPDRAAPTSEPVLNP